YYAFRLADLLHHLLLLRKRIGASGHKSSRPIDSLHYHNTLNASKVSGLRWVPRFGTTAAGLNLRKLRRGEWVIKHLKHVADSLAILFRRARRFDLRDRLYQRAVPIQILVSEVGVKELYSTPQPPEPGKP